MSLFKKKGFTLIELLTVIAIIGILASIVVVAVSEPRKRGRDAKRISDLKSIKTALEMYYEKNQSFPKTCYSSNDPPDPSEACAGDINTSFGQLPRWVESATTGTPRCEWDTTCSEINNVWQKNLSKYLADFISPLPVDPLNNKQNIEVVKNWSADGEVVTGDLKDCPVYKCGLEKCTTCVMAYFYRSDDGQNFKLASYLETLSDGNFDGGKDRWYYELFNSPEGQAYGIPY